VSVEGIRFSTTCHDRGCRIINASGYITEWMTLERAVSGEPRMITLLPFKTADRVGTHHDAGDRR